VSGQPTTSGGKEQAKMNARSSFPAALDCFLLLDFDYAGGGRPTFFAGIGQVAVASRRLDHELRRGRAFAAAKAICAAKYEVVRVEAPPRPTIDREITCVSCGAPLNGREGQLILKYFLVEGKRRSSRRQAPRPT
jgi:hypothetical protein